MSSRVSIITATYNSVDTIKDCLESVKKQEGDIEHIIIDGGSTDGTLDIVESYAHIARIETGQDRGIYDAMNKGILLATGEILGILNSDDFYANSNVIGKVQRVFRTTDTQSCYGDLTYVDAADTSKVDRSWKSGGFNSDGFLWGWMPPHPTFFVRRNVYNMYGMFKLSLGSAADYELMLRFLFKHKVSTVYIPEVLVKMRSGGASNRSIVNRLRANRMDRKAWEVNGLKPYPWTLLMKPLRKMHQFFVF